MTGRYRILIYHLRPFTRYADAGGVIYGHFSEQHFDSQLAMERAIEALRLEPEIEFNAADLDANCELVVTG